MSAKPWIPFESASRVPGLKALTTTRDYNLGLNTEAPAGEVVAARRELWEKAGLPLECSVFMHQVHGSRMQEVGDAQRGRGSLALEDALPDCDAMLSAGRGTYLCVGHADCLAVLLADPVRGAVAAAHCGWRGASLGIAGSAAAALIRQGSRPQDLWAGLSVCLGPCHLELSGAQHGIFSQDPRHGNWCSPLLDGHFTLDLWACASAQLQDQGLEAGQIDVQRLCTACNPGRFYSYRGEAGKCGRMMSVIGFDQ